MKVNGKTVKKKEKEFGFQKMVKHIMEIGQMIKEKVMEYGVI